VLVQYAQNKSLKTDMGFTADEQEANLLGFLALNCISF
jgi:hypothetical protein